MSSTFDKFRENTSYLSYLDESKKFTKFTFNSNLLGLPF